MPNILRDEQRHREVPLLSIPAKLAKNSFLRYVLLVILIRVTAPVERSDE